MHFNPSTYRLEDTARAKRIPLIVAAISIAGLLSSWSRSPEQFMHSYLNALLFWVGIGLGGLFLMLLHYLTGSIWSVAYRRIAESFASTLPITALLFIPILLQMGHLYEWSHADKVAASPLLQKKTGYLNVNFFTIRAVFYFAVWNFLAWRLGKLSDRQDAGHSEALRQSIIRTAAPGMIIFALTVAFASYDWMMSLQPEWYSTIYGVNFAMGSIMAALALMAVLFVKLRSVGAFENLSEERIHDLGKMLFAFVILWAYMAFSQYFLIWYANLPEETIFYHHRWVGSWKFVSMVIVFGHFVLPFLMLISRPAKRNRFFLAAMALWMLLMHWVDLYWNIEPNLHHDTAHIAPSDLTTMAVIGALFFWRFWSYLCKRPIVPIGDPKLAASMQGRS